MVGIGVLIASAVIVAGADDSEATLARGLSH